MFSLALQLVLSDHQPPKPEFVVMFLMPCIASFAVTLTLFVCREAEINGLLRHEEAYGLAPVVFSLGTGGGVPDIAATVVLAELSQYFSPTMLV